MKGRRRGATTDFIWLYNCATFVTKSQFTVSRRSMICRVALSRI